MFMNKCSWTTCSWTLFVHEQLKYYIIHKKCSWTSVHEQVVHEHFLFMNSSWTVHEQGVVHELFMSNTNANFSPQPFPAVTDSSRFFSIESHKWSFLECNYAVTHKIVLKNFSHPSPSSWRFRAAFLKKIVDPLARHVTYGWSLILWSQFAFYFLMN